MTCLVYVEVYQGKWQYLMYCMFYLFSVPSPPQNVRILGSTITQLKVGWDPPEDYNGVLKGYYVFLGKC